MDWVIGLLGAAAVLGAALWIFVKRHGDIHISFLLERRTPLRVTELTDAAVTLQSEIPFVNDGRQDGVVLDCFVRHYLPQEHFDGVIAESRLELKTAPRRDGYFESMIMKRGVEREVVLTIALTARAGTIREALRQMVDLPLDIFCQPIGRIKITVDKTRLVIRPEEIGAAVAKAAGKGG